MTKEDVKDFVKDLFTLRTVWIDRGYGRWVVKKRFHPALRSALWVIALIVCAGVYAALNGSEHSEAVAEQKAPMQNMVIAASLPEPDDAPPVQQAVIVPLKAQAKRNEIILPSEANPETDRIISPSTQKTEAPKVSAMPDPLDKSGKYSVDVNKSTYTLTLYRNGEIVKEYPIAIGKNPGDKQRTGDHRTPVGSFKIVSIENSSGWSHDFRDGKGKIKGAYGPYFLRLDAKGWKGIGIHGTHDPDSRGTMATEGCIRLSNEDIAELRQYAYKNMPVTIREN